MKTNLKNIGLLFLATISLVGCSKDDTDYTPTAANFSAIKEQGIQNVTQNFTATAGIGVITLTSAKGVVITLDGNALTINGNLVTGAIDITYIELFDKGTMLVTNRPTMGVMLGGDHALLKSGGEFFIKASQGGVDLATTANINLVVPTNLTGGVDTAMTLWTGEIANNELVWVAAMDSVAGGGVGIEQNNYYVSFGNFGWTNVDVFYSDPRPKTTILVGAPQGYNYTNSAIYLSYDGEGGNALANLDTYTSAGLFSEHYGQIPIGLECHIIFATEDNGQWRYGIKAVTISAGSTYTFSLAETTVGTEAQLVAAINALP